MKRFIAMLLVVLTLVAAIPMSAAAAEVNPETGMPFKDVTANHWFYNAVKYTYDKGIFSANNSAGDLFAPNVTISTTGHPAHPELRTQGMYSFPVTIGDNVWIGSGAIILPGVTIGENSIIGAGSVVTHDIPANVIAFGAPCKVQREITDRDKEFYYRQYRVDAQV